MRTLALSLAVLCVVALAAVVGVLGDAAGEAEAAPWTFGESMSQRRSYVAAADIDGKVYAAGGMVGETGRPLDLLARYDPAADSWETLRRMPEAVRAGAAAEVDGTLYVIGGTTAEGNSSAVFAYDPATDEWTERAPLPEPRFNHAAVALDGKIYVLGGFREGEELQDVDVYDPLAGAWRTTRPFVASPWTGPSLSRALRRAACASSRSMPRRLGTLTVWRPTKPRPATATPIVLMGRRKVYKIGVP